MVQKLPITTDSGYLNLEDLPHNCIFNKVITGCGGTTIALFNGENYVIAVPYVEIITNKTGLTEAGVASVISPEGKEVEVFGLFGSFYSGVQTDLRQYVNRPGIKKILCTYDKLPALEDYFKPSDYRLLVDEYQLLLKAYSYRRKAIEGVLDNFTKYGSFCFMSATPIAPDFQPSQLEGIPVIEAEWKEIDRLKVVLQPTNNPYTQMANIIQSYKTNGYLDINGTRSTEAFIFINSVTDIANILHHCNLSPEDTRVICADNEENLRKLPSGFTISNSRSASRMFTFITSKSFEGADYFSDTGVAFVVSNSSNRNTLLDISTDIYQIAGRIRTESNPFKNTIIHIFNTTGKRSLNIGITYEEMKDKVSKVMDNTRKIIGFVNDNPEVKSGADRLFNEDYVVEDENGIYSLNDTLIKLELFTFRIEYEIYTKGIAIRKAYRDSGGITITNGYDKVEGSIAKASKKLTFKEAFIMYCEAVEKKDTEAIKNLVQQQPLIEEAYKVLGNDKVRSLRYIKKAVEKELKAVDTSVNDNTRIARILNVSFDIGFYPSSKIKEEVQTAYNLLGIKDKAKATDITKWFEAEQITKRIEGKVTKGFQIYKQRYVFTNN